MDSFYEGLIAGIAMLGGLCAFIYWVFSLLEKRLESKLDEIAKDVHTVVSEQNEQRQRTDKLYEILIKIVENKQPKTNP